MGTNLISTWLKEWNAAWNSYVLPVAPDYPIAPEPQYVTRVNESEARYIQSFPLQSHSRRRWSGLQWRGLNQSDRDSLINFFDSRMGNLEGFIWEQPDSTQIKCAVLGQSITEQRTGPAVFTVTADFIELIDNG